MKGYCQLLLASADKAENTVGVRGGMTFSVTVRCLGKLFLFAENSLNSLLMSLRCVQPFWGHGVSYWQYPFPVKISVGRRICFPLCECLNYIFSYFWEVFVDYPGGTIMRSWFYLKIKINFIFIDIKN